LAESVHEIFDEYYSVSLSFWTKMGLREKARPGLSIGGLPWGYVKGEDGVAIPDPERAPVVQALFTIYATGRYSLRDLANWLNERDHRTTRGNLFCAEHRPRHVVQPDLLRLRHGAAEHEQGDPRPPRAAGRRGAVRSRRRAAPPADDDA
jgi:DNA invertase Pin-like site-specific DNA recombinase